MKAKPVVILIEESDLRLGSGFEENSHRNGFAYFLREQYGCEVVVFENEYYFQKNLKKIKKLIEDSFLALIIVAQRKYDNPQDDIIQTVRGDLSSNLPIVVIPENLAEKKFTGVPGDNQIFVCSYYETGLLELIKKIIADFQPLVEQSVVIQTDEKKLPEGLFPVSSAIYEQEIAKIRTMSEKGRDEFSRKLYHATGRDMSPPLAPEYVYGFAIDPITLEYLFTGRMAHSICDDILAYRIMFIEQLKAEGWLSAEMERYCRQRIVSGLVVPSVEGFITSIFIVIINPFYDKRVTDFLKEQRILLPVTFNGNLPIED